MNDVQQFDTELRNEHYRLLGLKNKVNVNYGTSGFREVAEILPFIAWRIGLFMGITAKSQQVGVVVTASHNPILDNGFKIVPANGEMLPQQDEINLEQYVRDPILRIPQSDIPNRTVYVGRDTRPSSKGLSELVLKGIAASGATGVDVGEVTTPQMFFLIKSVNTKLIPQVIPKLYVDYFCDLYLQLVKGDCLNQVVIDCAEGVGGLWISQFAQRLKDVILITGINCGEQSELLNDGCGSEFVQKQQKIPKNHKNIENAHYASLDGDADRLIYYDYQNLKIQAIDGDRLAILFAEFIQHELAKYPQLHFNIGIIQTAYANGSSTKYIREIVKVDAKFEPTGVKYLHRAAHHYDIGIYFEANGHGSVLVKQHVFESLDKNSELTLFLQICNSAIGDSIINILLTEYILNRNKWNISKWISQFDDYPTASTKIPTKHKSVIKTNYEETQLTEPIIFSQQVQQIVDQFGNEYRVCIRPSGTEDVIRIHTEGPKQEQVIELHDKIVNALNQYLSELH